MERKPKMLIYYNETIRYFPTATTCESSIIILNEIFGKLDKRHEKYSITW